MTAAYWLDGYTWKLIAPTEINPKYKHNFFQFGENLWQFAFEIE